MAKSAPHPNTMKLSEALEAGFEMQGLEEQSFHRGPNGYQGDLADREALAKWLRKNPLFDTEVRQIALPVGEKILRPQQSKFRKALMQAFGGKCAITGEQCVAVLEAAHLPGKSHALGHNSARDGILLRADLHKLMDANPPLLILGIENDGIVVRIQKEAGSNYQKLNGKKIQIPKGH